MKACVILVLLCRVRRTHPFGRSKGGILQGWPWVATLLGPSKSLSSAVTGSAN